MSTVEKPLTASLPDHTQLPESDGTFVKNFQEHPQSILLTDSIEPLLKRDYPDGHYAIGQDSGIYWRLPNPPERLERGAESPDWFVVLGVPPTYKGRSRRSYVLWHEVIPPLIILEFVSGDGSEERDRTPITGKFWVYEQAIKPMFYGIYEVEPGRIEMYHRVGDRFQLLPPNESGRFRIDGLGVELGLWQGEYQNINLPWMRWWDADGRLLPTGHELAAIEAERADLEAERADLEAERADLEANRADREAELADLEADRANREADRVERLINQLRALGLEPDA